MLRWWTLVAFVLAGCAQGVPSDSNSNNGGSKKDLRHSDDDEDLKSPSADLRKPPADMAGGGSGDEDLAASEDVDLATPDDVDLAGADLKQAATADLKPAPADLYTAPADLTSCAAKENCFNSIDDDCTGGVNNGCPNTISLGTPVSLGYVGGPGGGTGSVRCPAGQMVGAARYFYDDYDGQMAGMGIFCSTPTLLKGSSTYSISATDITSVTPINFYGTGWDDFNDSANCVAGGAFGTVWHHEIMAGTYVDGVLSQCGTGTVTLQSNNTLTISFTQSGNVTGGYYVSPPGTTKNCPSGSVLVGYDYRIGSWMDALAPVCAPIIVNYL